MIETDLKVLRSASLKELQQLLKSYQQQGWEPVGQMEVFDGQCVQPIRIAVIVDETEEITQEITQEHNPYNATD